MLGKKTFAILCILTVFVTYDAYCAREEEVDFDSISFSEMLRGDDVCVIMSDADSGVQLDPTLFDIKAEIENGFLFEDISVKVVDGMVRLRIQPRGQWCDCFFPNVLHLTIVSTPKEGMEHYEGRTFPVKVSLIKQNSWLSRCSWVILTIGILLLVVLYLFALMKKNRFRKNSCIQEFYTQKTIAVMARQNQTPVFHRLRQKGVLPWMNRWLNPFADENCAIRFAQSNNVTISFVADGNPNSYVKVDKACFDEKYMSVKDYDPKKSNAEEKCFRWSAGGNLLVVKDRTNSRLVYYPGAKDDVAAVKSFMGFLIAASLFVIVVLIILML